MTEAPATEMDPVEFMRSKAFVVVLVLSVIVGVIVSFLSWAFLEAVYQVGQLYYDHLPSSLGFDTVPVWWCLPALFIAGFITAFAIDRLPGGGGHIPAEGLKASPTLPIALPGVILAALAGIGLGVVLGPEAPLMAIGGGIGYLLVRMVKSDAPPALGQLISVAGIFAGLSFLFGSPVIAAVIVIEASGLGGRRLPLLLIPGLLAAGIGSVVSTGLGSWTGVDMSDITIQLLKLPSYPTPDLVSFLWTVPLAVVIAAATYLIFRIGRATKEQAGPRPFLVLPAVGLIVGGLAIAFQEITDKGTDQVLFSGQDSIGGLVANSSEWSLGALAALILFKGVAYGLSLGSFRGGPTFPAMLIGAAAGLMATHLPGFDLAPAVAVGIGCGVVAVLRLPLSAVVLATLLTSQAGLGVTPLVVLGVAVTYLVINALDPKDPPDPADLEPAPVAAPAPASGPAPA